RDTALLERWARVFEARDLVMRALEEARVSKLIGSSLEAHVQLQADRKTFDLLAAQRGQLPSIFIVSQVSLALADHADPVTIAGGAAVSVAVKRADGGKCERCWNYSTRVGEFARYPSVCERCIEALAEIEAEGSDS
ncbi:MAG: isoleucine--tRNA ligase, partial [Acidobacteria bacterium]|nr:isoleucine--tRNA ligase [Acidobacteriota bacterium]